MGGARGEFVISGVLSPIGFVSIEEMHMASGMPELGEGRNYFDLVEVDAPDK